MSFIDIAIIALITLSGVISLMRGFVKEAVSLLIWATAVLLALRFATLAGDWALASIASHGLRYAIAFATIMVACLLVGTIINAAISAIVRHTGAGGADRFLGIIFGVARGYLVIAVLLMLATLTQAPDTKWWQQSILIPQFQPSVNWLKKMLPKKLTDTRKWIEGTDSNNSATESKESAGQAEKFKKLLTPNF